MFHQACSFGLENSPFARKYSLVPDPFLQKLNLQLLKRCKKAFPSHDQSEFLCISIFIESCLLVHFIIFTAHTGGGQNHNQLSYCTQIFFRPIQLKAVAAGGGRFLQTHLLFCQNVVVYHDIVAGGWSKQTNKQTNIKLFIIIMTSCLIISW